MTSICLSFVKVGVLSASKTLSGGRRLKVSITVLLLWAAVVVPSNRAVAETKSDLNTAKFNCCYRVTGVSANDTLNVRAEPGRTDTLVGQIPPNATGIRVAQCKRVPPTNATWCFIQYQALSGWVNGRFITQ